MTEGSGRRRVFFPAAAGAFAAATAALFVVSRGKWSDALVDSGREWIVPDALARGDLLYRDVVYWFGPFTPYFHASFFEVLGSSFRTLVIAGVVGSLGALAALYFALRAVTDRWEAALWTALAVPALVFMPNAGGSILGMGYRMWHAAAFALLAVAGLVRARDDRHRWSTAAAGVLAGLAGLCRTEWGIAALVSCFLALALRERSGRAWLRDAFVAASSALLVFGGVVGFFVIAAGADAVLADGPLLLFGIPEETRANVAFAGLRSWRTGLVPLLYSSLLWLGAVLAVELVALRREDRSRARKPLSVLLAILAALAVLALFAGGTGAVLFSAAPAVCALSLFLGVRRRGTPSGAALAGFGLLGLLSSHRAFFHVSDGPYVAPPLLVAFVCAAALLRLFVARDRPNGASETLRRGLLAATGALVAFAFGARLFQYLSDDRVPIPGTDGMLSARPDMAHEIAELAALVRRETEEGSGLVVFPEGEILNSLSGRANPIRYKLYLPGYLASHNESAVIRELERRKPAAVIVWRRMTHEYGPGSFGVDYGRELSRWVEKNYPLRDFRSPAIRGPARPSFRYGLAEWKEPA